MRFLQVTIMAVATLLTLASCGKQVPIDDATQPKIEVTYNTIDGSWQLTHLDGSELLDATILYISFDRDKRSFEMWTNIGSMYPRRSTGQYSILAEEDGTYTLQGSYDNGVGDWNDMYRVEMPTRDRMLWRSRTTGVCMDFARIESIPEFN